LCVKNRAGAASLIAVLNYLAYIFTLPRQECFLKLAFRVLYSDLISPAATIARASISTLYIVIAKLATEEFI
jgi:Fe-S oxidoreductase